MSAQLIMGGTAVREVAYLFIDGGHLRHHFVDNLQRFFGPIGNLLKYLDLKKLRGSAAKAFYYDCEDEGDQTKEADGQKQTKEFFQRIRAEPRYHLRLGTLIKSKKGLRQKEVDVYLAVEALKHGFHGNYTEARIITGDRDFKPLVDALIDIGVYVTVYYAKGHGAKELLEAADRAQEIRLSTWYQWTSDEFQNKYSVPNTFYSSSGPNPGPGYQVHREGLFSGQPGVIWKTMKGQKLVYRLIVPNFDGRDSALVVDSHDLKKLENYFRLEFGSWTLEDAPRPR